jgi:hypothetical protein
MHISHIIFLIHPCCYEPIEAEQIKLEGLQLYLDREQEVKTRWLAEISAGAAGTMFVQLGGPVYLTQAAEKTLQPGCAVSLQFPFPESQDLHTYYEGLSTEIRSHLQAHRLELNQATVTSELWGESFEGCVPGYGGAFAQHLGLQTSPRMRYEMTVFDAWRRCLSVPQTSRRGSSSATMVRVPPLFRHAARHSGWTNVVLP